MSDQPARPPREALIAVALVSFSILAAEVAFTRVFSVLFRAPYVFLILSGAIGGLGLGGLLVQAVRPTEERLRGWIVALSLLFCAALAAPILFLFASPWGRDLVAGAETAVVVAFPMFTYTVAGMLLSLLFRQYAASGGLLYFVDLVAAAVGAPVTVLLLDQFGGINTPLILALLVAVAGLFLALRSPNRLRQSMAVVAVAATASVLTSNLQRSWIDLPVLKMPYEATRDPEHPWNLRTKPLYKELANPFTTSKIVRTDWTAVSRTDVVEDDPNAFYIYTDGDVPTQMIAWDGKIESARRDYAAFIGALPYRLARNPVKRVMAIGAGGGLDVLLAKAGGAEQVDAVEINPSIPRIVADPRFAHTYAQIYRTPGVRLVVDEGRSFLQREGKYDLVYFACAKTATTQTSGVALLDNHLYTVEAFQDYWHHLNDEGMTALVTQESFLIDRLLLTALTALQQEGLTLEEARTHVLTARIPERRFPEGPYRHILLLSRKAWSAAEMDRVRQRILMNELEPLYLPHVQPQGADGGAIRPGGSLADFRHDLEAQYPVSAAPGSRSVPVNLSAVTDDSPFYVDVAQGVHPMLQQLLSGSLLATVVVFVLVAGYGFLAGRQERASGEVVADPIRPGGLARWMLYFAMLGAGFMLVELALVQRFVLLLGFPTRSLTVTLAALLVSSALGSWVSQKGTPEMAVRRLVKLMPALLLLLVGYRFFLPLLLQVLLPLPLWAREVGTALLLLPAGFLMGMPFPTALRALGESYGRMIPAFWSVNGVTSILGSVATMALAKFVSYSGALLVGAGCYLLAWIALAASRARTGAADSTATAVSPK
jgi:spermidine synthase